MRSLLVIIFSATLIWSAYWTIGAQRTKAGLNTWLTEKNDAGFDIHIEDISLWGFPNRFDVTMTPVWIEADQWGFSWRGAFLQILRLSYDRDHTIFVFPERHELKLDNRDVTIFSDRMRASSVSFGSGNHRFVLEAQNLSVQSENLNYRFGNAQLAFLISKYQSELRLNITTEDAQSLYGPNSLLLSANLSSERGFVAEDLALFDVRSLLFDAIELHLEDKVIHRDPNFLTFSQLLAVPEILKALDKIKTK